MWSSVYYQYFIILYSDVNIKQKTKAKSLK